MKNFEDNEYSNSHIRLVLTIIAIILLLVCTEKCCAQKQTAVYDTVRIENRCIEKYVQSSDQKKIYAVFNDGRTTQLVSVSKSVYEYVVLCEENKINPSLAIKLKNGKISSLIKYVPTYVIK